MKMWDTLFKKQKKSKLKVQQYTKIELPYDSAMPLLEENKTTDSKRYSHPNVHSSVNYNSQDSEAT